MSHVSKDVFAHRVILGYFYLWCLIMAVFLYIWWPFIGGMMVIIVSVGSTLLLLAVYMTYKIRYQATLAIIPFYILILTLGLYPLLAVDWYFGNVTTYIWYLTAPVKLSTVYSRRTTMYWCLYLLALIVSSFFTAGLLPPLVPQELVAGDEQRATLVIAARRSSVCTLLIAFVELMYFLYFKDRISHVLRPNEPDPDAGNPVKPPGLPAADSDARHDALHARIVNYFETKQPFRNCEYSISQLAVALNNNTTYVAKAIQHCEGMNFTTFLNTWRIRHVKTLLQLNSSKFTLHYIYTVSGFRNQSTFNRTFKIITGITPSEYCRQIDVSLPDE
jgi:AraC-like DNA-binding protein